MGLAETVKQSLEALNLPGDEVEIHKNGYYLMANLVTDSFQTMDEGERQKLVWTRPLADLTDGEVSRIECIFTDTPAETQAVGEQD